MSREPGKAPDFDRLLIDLGRAKSRWDAGDRKGAERILQLLGSIAIAESSERAPNDPIPQTKGAQICAGG